MKPWTQTHTDMIRADARAGWTLNECALNRKLHPATVSKHAKLNDIVFVKKQPPAPSQGVAAPTKSFDVGVVEAERRKAMEQLHIEIRAA